MKKLIMSIVLVAGMMAMGSTDVYAFKTTMKYPTIGKTAFVPTTSSVTGTLTIEDADSTNATATLVVTVKKTKTTYVLEAEGAPVYAVFGKKVSDCSTEIKFTNVDASSDGILELTVSGFGTVKTKKTGGCTPCGDTTQICSKMNKLSGVSIGKYACPCGGNFIEWDGSCELDVTNVTAEYSPVYCSGTSLVLKTVDGKKW